MLYWEKSELSDAELEGLERAINGYLYVIDIDENPENAEVVSSLIEESDSVPITIRQKLGWTLSDPEFLLLILESTIIFFNLDEVYYKSKDTTLKACSRLERVFGDSEEISEEEALELIEEHTINSDVEKYN